MITGNTETAKIQIKTKTKTARAIDFLFRSSEFSLIIFTLKRSKLWGPQAEKTNGVVELSPAESDVDGYSLNHQNS